MKQLFLLSMLALAQVQGSFGQQILDTYLNAGPLLAPPAPYPVVDATNFVNKAAFEIGISTAIGSAPFGFNDVLHYTNFSTMFASTGFNFDYTPSAEGALSGMALTFVNTNLATVQAVNTTSPSAPGLVGSDSLLPQININSSNVVNTGTLLVDLTGTINITGNKLNLAKGTIHVQGFAEAAATGLGDATLGIFDVLYGVGLQSNLLSVANFKLPNVFTPASKATNIDGTTNLVFTITLGNPTTFFDKHVSADNSNATYQAVFVVTTNRNISTDVRFAPGPATSLFKIPVVQLSAVIQDAFGNTVTNDIYISDQFGAIQTNGITTNGVDLVGSPQLAPTNYMVTRSFAGYDALPMADNGFTLSDTNFTRSLPTTNAYSVYEVNVQPVVFETSSSTAATPIDRLPGRITITATNANSSLDLTRAKVTGANYLSIVSTNNFVGASGAQIEAPNMNVELGSTNGLLTISNVVPPFVARYTGPIFMYSARWTNVVTNTMVDGMGMTNMVFLTNTFHFLVLGDQLSPTAAINVMNLNATSASTAAHPGGEVVIGDNLVVSSNLDIIAGTLTVASQGVLNLTQNPNIFWSSSFPILENVDNFGSIVASTATYFESIQSDPFYPTNSTQPYQSFANHGFIGTGGLLIWAVNFTNSSIESPADLNAAAGFVSIQANNAVLSRGTIEAGSDLDIAAGNLAITNHVITAAGAFSLSVTNLASDGGAASGNLWTMNNGFNLLTTPANGSFLGTTVDDVCPAGLEVVDFWTAANLGASAAGFANNGAIGHLILDGSSNVFSEFFFGGPGTNAIYVDRLDLTNGATNIVISGGSTNYNALDIDPNFTIYYADFMVNGMEMSQLGNGAHGIAGTNGGRLVWVPSFSGVFSSVGIVSKVNGVNITNFYNKALAQSTNIDSDGDGVMNAMDTTPFFTASSINPSITMTNLPPKVPLLQWTTLAQATNFVYFATSFPSTNWTLVTNFVSSNGVHASFVDRTRTSTSSGYYRVQVAPKQP